jgi:hypothetical protein
MLNTLKGMGLVAVGYASEELPFTFSDIFGRFRSSGYFVESSQRKASRIVTLAKKAVYDEMSIPCDMTSAEKALVLIAGPSHELSMRGFQTIRMWIDRSIAGLEMRSGDYPVRNTRFVGIIVVLSGITNIPRVEEIRQIRAQSRSETDVVPAELDLSSDHVIEDNPSVSVSTGPQDLAASTYPPDTQGQTGDEVYHQATPSVTPTSQGTEQSSTPVLHRISDHGAVEDTPIEHAHENEAASSAVRSRSSDEPGTIQKSTRKRKRDDESENGIIWFR